MLVVGQDQSSSNRFSDEYSIVYFHPQPYNAEKTARNLEELCRKPAGNIVKAGRKPFRGLQESFENTAEKH